MSVEQKSTHYMGNPLLKRANQSVDWTPELVEEYIKCSQDPIYFTENYIKIISDALVGGGGLVPFILYPYQKDMMQSFKEERYSIVTSARQPLDLETDILTDIGFKKLKDIDIGDIVYDENANKVTVTSKTDIFKDHKCYDVIFCHGESVRCSANHLWTVELNKRHSIEEETLTTDQLKHLLEYRQSKDQSIRIKCAEPIIFKEKDLSIDPYLFGLWLGDGHSDGGRITCHVDDLKVYTKQIKDEHYILGENYQNKNIRHIRVKGLTTKLRKINCYKNKHIPEDYIFNSIENRVAVIQGLMDTDGSVKRGSGACEFYQKNKDIVEQFRFVLSSLGIKSKIRNKIIKGQTYYTVSFCNRKYDFFRLPRKLELTKNNKFDHIKNYYFYIKEIKEAEKVPVRCIGVNNESHLFLCGKTLIPTHNSGKSTVVCAFLLWYVLFHSEKTVALLANKGETAREILGRIQTAYQHLPPWLQQGIVEWNKGSIVLENNSRIVATATSATSIRGYTINLLFIDEAAFIENWEEFFTSVSATITAVTESKIILVSTPKGLNHFHMFWVNAEQERNGYRPIMVRWFDVPGRDEVWKKEYLQSINFDMQKFNQEMMCEFLGSSGTLIAGWKLKELVQQAPLLNVAKHEGLTQYCLPEKEHRYVITVDVSRGKGLDYSAFQLIDVTDMPYKQVAVYRNNNITPGDYASVIHYSAKNYNEAAVLVEINDIGEQVSNQLLMDFGYENLLYTENAGRSGKRVTAGFGGGNCDRGIRTTKVVKSVGCSLMKLLIEGNQMIINDYDSISELTTFSKKNFSYEAESGKHDDLVMCLHRNNKILTEAGEKTIKWVVDNKYNGKVWSFNEKVKEFEWNKIIGWSAVRNINKKKWVRIECRDSTRGRKKLICTEDHRCAVVKDILNPEIEYAEAKDIENLYSVRLPIQHENKCKWHNNNSLFNKDQLSTLIGILLGDGSINKKGQFTTAHGPAQHEYLKYISSIVGGNYYPCRSNGVRNAGLVLNVPKNDQTKHLREIAYCEKKTVKNIIPYINELSLAFWYMDDGYLKKSKGCINHSVELCTDGFDYDDHLLLVKMFSDKFNIKASIVRLKAGFGGRKVAQYRLRIGTASSKKFFHLIAPYICESMHYKLPLQHHNLEKYIFNTNYLKYSANKVSKCSRYNKTVGDESKLYDITVENVHNFVANETLVHNCLVLFSWLTEQNYFKEYTDINTLQRLREKSDEELGTDMLCFGFVNDGRGMDTELPEGWEEVTSPMFIQVPDINYLG